MIEVEEFSVERIVELIFARSQLDQQLFENTGNASGEMMQLGSLGLRKYRRSVRRRRILHQRRGFIARKRSDLKTLESIEVLPDRADFLSLGGAGGNPNRNAFSQMGNKPRNSRRYPCHAIEHKQFAAPGQMGQEAILPLDYIHLAMSPAELAFEALADFPETRRLFAQQKGKVLARLPNECALSDPSRSGNQYMPARAVRLAESVHFFLASDKVRRYAHRAGAKEREPVISKSSPACTRARL